MKCYHDEYLEAELASQGRTQPWTFSEHDASFQYYDLRSHPEYIETRLEDVVAFPAGPAREAVVDLLQWINSDASKLESNDFALARPATSTTNPALNSKPLECRGRLAFFQRHLEENAYRNSSEMGQLIETGLTKIDPTFSDGCWGWALWPHRFLALSDGGVRFCVALLFWAWGTGRSEVLENTARTITNLKSVLRQHFSTGL